MNIGFICCTSATFTAKFYGAGEVGKALAGRAEVDQYTQCWKGFKESWWMTTESRGIVKAGRTQCRLRSSNEHGIGQERNL